MDYRHEWKYEINRMDLLILRQRLGAVMSRDSNTVNGTYTIRSLYFDDLYDTALREKIDGVSRREKFRIRYYNGDTSFIRLEKKCKDNNLCGKLSAAISAEEVKKLLDGEYEWMSGDSRPLVRELYTKVISRGLRPTVIVDYKREPYTYAPGNVRVTLDTEIRTCRQVSEFLNPDCITLPTRDSQLLLEVKWDAYLPDVIRAAVQMENRRAGAFSKYAACRVYG